MGQDPVLRAAMVLICVAASLPSPSAGQPAATGKSVIEGFHFGPFLRAIEGLSDPRDVAVAEGGSIFVVETGAHRIQILSPDGEVRAIWGRVGTDPGQLLAPRGLALHADEVIVADSGNHRIQVFDHGGRSRRRWGGYGSGPGQFNQPAGLSVDDDRVYVADVGNDRVQVFDHQGRFLFAVGCEGEEDDRLGGPVDVAVDPVGRMFVVDGGSNRMQVFDAEGRRMRAWGDWGPFYGLFDGPIAACWHGDRLLVVDERNHRIQAFDGDGEFELAWGVHEPIPHQAQGRLHYPSGLAVAPSGRFAVVCETMEDRLQLFAAAEPSATRAPPPPVQKPDQTHFGEHLAIDGRLLAVAEPEAHFIYVFDVGHEVPINISQFGERGRGFGLMARTGGLAIDFDDRAVLVCDRLNRRLQRFRLDYDPAGPLRYRPDMARFAVALDLDRVQGPATGVSAPGSSAIDPMAIARDRDGNTYLLDTRNCEVVVLDERLAASHRWGGRGEGDGLFQGPTDLAVGELVYVVDSLGARIHAFDRGGSFRFSFGSRGVGEGQVLAPFGIAVGAGEFLYVTDASAHRVVKFDRAGRFVGFWGEKGDGMGQLWKPRGIASDDQGRLYVVDHGNHRIQIFDPEGTWLVTFTAGKAYTRSRPPRQEG
jgi:DNA-binding beta-propeller fold protein YncE